MNEHAKSRDWKTTKMLLAAALAAATVVSTAAAKTTPKSAARATRDCFKAHGWQAALSHGGVRVDARAARKLPAYPFRPTYSVTFLVIAGVVGPFELRLKLNASEGRIATLCREQGLHHR
jgi:hypothetical protein